MTNHRPDFAKTTLDLEDRDLQYLIKHFPTGGTNYEEIARLINQLPTTFESLLSSEYLYHSLWSRRDLILDVSPFLFFNVLLRRLTTEHRTPEGRRIINYLANLLSLFIMTDRLYRVQPHETQAYEYLIDLMAEAATQDSRRQFLIYSHIGNYTLFMTGLFPQWIEHRHRYRRRPVDAQYYVDFGRSHFKQAATHHLAREFALDDVFLRLAIMFESYRDLLNQLRQHYFQGPQAAPQNMP